MYFNKITDLNISGKRLFIRTDMNVPIEGGVISDATRIEASVATIRYALEMGAKIILATHLGRPVEGHFSVENSVVPIAKYLEKLLGVAVPVISNWQNDAIDFSNTNIVMLENVRFNLGEKANSSVLGEQYAKLCDIFVHDAFATAHRAEASTDAVGYASGTVCAGILLTQELDALSTVMDDPQHPIVAIVGGAKVSSKLTILNNLANKVDVLIVGGGILNTFLLAAGYSIGASLAEVDLVDEARRISAKMAARGALIPLPEYVVVAEKFAPDAKALTKSINEISAKEMILDVGSQFSEQLTKVINDAGTIIWNGPLGVFEFDQFASGTKLIAEQIANSHAYSLAGGGDTIAAINKFGVFDKISYVSTAGGALLEFLEGKELPAIRLLTTRIN